MSIFMKINGAVGSVSAEGYQGWVECDSLHFKVNRHAHMPVGRPQERERSEAAFSELVIAKQQDGSSHLLFQYACTGRVFEKIELHVCSTDTLITPHSKYTLSNVVITHFEQFGSSAELPSELLHFNYTKLECAYIARDATNTSQSPKITGYNLETAQLM